MSDSRRTDPRLNSRWQAADSGSTLGSALRRLFPRPLTMQHPQTNDFSINVNAQENRVNELEETASTRSSFADVLESSNVEIRDGSYQRGEFNPTTSLLQTCKNRVIFPYFCILCMVSWRPFRRQSFRHQKFWKSMNILYTLFIFVLIIFSYASSVIACQARLDVKLEPEATRPTTSATTHKPRTTTPINITTAPPSNATTPKLPSDIHKVAVKTLLESSGSDTVGTVNLLAPTLSSLSWPASSKIVNYTNSSDLFVPYTMAKIGSAKPYWQPAFTDCHHIFSTYVVPNFLHFLAFVLGFYHFRIQESEELHALIEKVFLLSSVPKRIVSRVRLFLSLGKLWVLLSAGNFALFCYANTLDSVTGFSPRTRAKEAYIVVSVMAMGKVLESCVSAVTVVNYCAQCDLLNFYLRDIGLRMEEKSGDLNIIMKDVLDVKKNLSRVNGIISVIATLIVFNHCELVVIGLYNLMLLVPDKLVRAYLAEVLYRAFTCLLSFFLIVWPIMLAARLTSVGRDFKQKSLQIRAFGYPSASQLDLDSFVLFCHSSDIKAKLLCMPVKSSFVMGLGALIVFVLLLMLQTSVIGGNNRYL